MLRRMAVLAIVMSVASLVMAGPLTLPMSHPYRIQLSLDDGSSLYADNTPIPDDFDLFQFQSVEVVPGVYYRVPELEATLNGLELRGAWASDQISVTSSPSQQVYSPADGFDVTGCVHGLQIVEAVVVDTSMGANTSYFITLEYAPTVDQNVTVLGDHAHPSGQAAIVGGGRVTFYTDTTDGSAHDYDPDGNHSPDDWVTTTDGRLEFRTFGTIDADGSTSPNVEVLSDSIFVNMKSLGIVGIINDNTVMKAKLFLNSDGTSEAGSSSEAYLNSIRDITEVDLTTLAGDGSIMDNEMGIRRMPPTNLLRGEGGDAYILSDLQWGWSRTGLIWDPAAGVYTGWMFSSHDPVEFVTVPEPATCILLGGALVALVRRRKRS